MQIRQKKGFEALPAEYRSLPEAHDDPFMGMPERLCPILQLVRQLALESGRHDPFKPFPLVFELIRIGGRIEFHHGTEVKAWWRRRAS
jgi:hypothetical protein